MLYTLLQQTQKWLDDHGLYQIVMVLNQLEFRAFFAVVVSFTIVLLFGKRIFRCSPIHHHFHLAGWSEQQVVTRFWILGVVFAMIALVSLKLR